MELAEVKELLNYVKDPEIPVLTIAELGILQNVNFHDDRFKVTITPTYSGCPAVNIIRSQITMTLTSHGVNNFDIVEQLDPPWTTDFMSEEAKKKLEEFGIAPPRGKSGADEGPERCPHCGSSQVKEVTPFSSTACKAFYTCQSCLEPFDYFKCH